MYRQSDSGPNASKRNDGGLTDLSIDQGKRLFASQLTGAIDY
jgi:hypothetical protein